MKIVFSFGFSSSAGAGAAADAAGAAGALAAGIAISVIFSLVLSSVTSSDASRRVRPSIWSTMLVNLGLPLVAVEADGAEEEEVEASADDVGGGGGAALELGDIEAEGCAASDDVANRRAEVRKVLDDDDGMVGVILHRAAWPSRTACMAIPLCMMTIYNSALQSTDNRCDDGDHNLLSIISVQN